MFLVWFVLGELISGALMAWYGLKLFRYFRRTESTRLNNNHESDRNQRRLAFWLIIGGSSQVAAVIFLVGIALPGVNIGLPKVSSVGGFSIAVNSVSSFMAFRVPLFHWAPLVNWLDRRGWLVHPSFQRTAPLELVGESG